jgi:hypothetical protein
MSGVIASSLRDGEVESQPLLSIGTPSSSQDRALRPPRHKSPPARPSDRSRLPTVLGALILIAFATSFVAWSLGYSFKPVNKDELASAPTTNSSAAFVIPQPLIITAPPTAAPTACSKEGAAATAPPAPAPATTAATTKTTAPISPAPAADAPLLDLALLDRVVAASAAAKGAIWRTWDISQFPLFLTAMHVPRRSWALQRAKFVRLLLQHPLPAFVASFGGSSVTAGHDNNFTAAWPAVFERTVQPVFALLGGVRARNQAMGANPCLPYDACTRAHLGDDSDVIGWEQTYMCQNDPIPAETFIR